MKYVFTLSCLLLSACFCALIEAANANEKKLWNGFEREDFKISGRDSILVSPQNPRKDKAWIWRPAWFDAFPNADIELLKRGFYLAYFDVTHLYASPRSMDLMDEFYYAMQKRGLSKKVALEGISRGGAAALMWANRDPSKVSCVYVDAPVCDFDSWPGQSRKKLYADFLKEWGIKDTRNFSGNPIDNYERLAQSGVPVLIVAGDADVDVPYSKNGEIYKKRFFDSGGNIRSIVKAGCAHHPHGFENPEEIAGFIEDSQNAASSNKTEIYGAITRFKVRGGVRKSLKKFAEQRRGTVAFIGGSITEMRGWKENVQSELKRRFPETEFTFLESGISSLGSSAHAFRILKDIPQIASVDMVFLEAAVNDDTNGFYGKYAKRGYEGVIRHILLLNPDAEIVCLHFASDELLKKCANGAIPDVIKSHEEIASHYKLPSVNLSSEVADKIASGIFGWEKFGGTHPSPFGHKLYSEGVKKVFDASEQLPCPENNPPLPLPADKFSYFNGDLIGPDSASVKCKSGWAMERSWTPKKKGHVRTRYKNIPLLETGSGGSELSVSFKGSAIGVYCLAGPDAGIIEYSIDGSRFKKIDIFTRWSRDLYLPRIIVFDDELSDGQHVLKLKTSYEKNPGSLGNSCQIIGFCVNGKQ